MAELGFQRFFAGPYFHKGEFRKAGGMDSNFNVETLATYTGLLKQPFGRLMNQGS